MHPTWSRSSVPGSPSSTASSSNDPTTKINKEVISKRRESHRSTGLDHSSSEDVDGIHAFCMTTAAGPGSENHHVARTATPATVKGVRHLMPTDPHGGGLVGRHIGAGRDRPSTRRAIHDDRRASRRQPAPAGRVSSVSALTEHSRPRITAVADVCPWTGGGQDLPSCVARQGRRRRAGAVRPARAAGHGVRGAGRAPAGHRAVHLDPVPDRLRDLRPVPGAGARSGLRSRVDDRGHDPAAAAGRRRSGPSRRARLAAGGLRRRDHGGRRVWRSSGSSPTCCPSRRRSAT